VNARFLLITTLIVACGAPAEDEPTCGFALAPDAEAAAAAEDTAARWSAATGCAVTVREDGLPVLTVDQSYDLEGNPKHGGTWRDGDTLTRIELTRRNDPDAFARALLHESGHALRDIPGHSASGLMSATGGPIIDAESLAFVCEGLGCTAFEPE
jgi:hypothetical protein